MALENTTFDTNIIRQIFYFVKRVIKERIDNMTVEEIKKEIQTEPYEFLKSNPNLNNNIILMGLGGSHAYGTNNENSDIDIRGDCYK